MQIWNFKIDGLKYNFEKSSTTEVGEHVPCGYSMPTIWKFDGIENKHDVHRGEDYWKFLWILKRAPNEDN